MPTEKEHKIPIEWRWMKLSSIAFIEDHLRQPVNNFDRQRRIDNKDTDQLFPYYGATGQVGLIDEYLLDGDYILVGEDGAPFLDLFKDKAYEIKGKTWVNNHAHVIRASKFISQKYLLHYLNQLDYKPFVSGTTRLKLNKSALLNIPVPISSKEEQNRIAYKIEEIFSELDNAAVKLRELLKRLDIYQQVLLTDVFSKVTVTKNLLLKDVCSIMGGVTKGRKLDGRQTIDLPYLRVANVQDGYLNLSDVKTITVLQTDKDKYELKYGDILYTEGGDRDKLGRGTVWKNEIKNCIHQNHVFRARPISDNFNSFYISYYSKTKEAREYFFKNGKQTTNLASINISVLSNLPIPLVSIEEQIEVVNKLDFHFSIYNNTKESVETAINEILKFKFLILKKAFTGNLVERDPTDGKVSALLTNIDLEKKENESKINGKKKPSARKKMKELKKGIIEVLQESGSPLSAKEVWERSSYKGNIEKFYSELKKVQNLVTEVEKGILSINHQFK